MMYHVLDSFFERPEPFSVYTTDTLWTDPHIASQMLRFHLDQTNDLASRRATLIDDVVSWLEGRIGFSGKSVCDLGCGPGLYATRMSQRGATVTGIDFSASSIDYAQKNSTAENGALHFRVADYLKDELPQDQDIVTLIYADLCAMSPANRKLMYSKIKKMLRPGGSFVFDVFSVERFQTLHETEAFGRRSMDGFWSAQDYFGLQKTFLYPDHHISLDRYLIVENTRTFEIFNWMQYFSPDAIRNELIACGFPSVEIVDLSTGKALSLPSTAEEFAVIARVS